MAFVDELKKMEMQPKAENNAKFDKEIEEIYENIKQACIMNNNKHSVNGYIVRHYDDEYCVYGFEFKDTLNRNNSGHLTVSSKYRNKNEKYYSNIALCRYYKAGREGYEPISVQKTECDSYIYRLKDLLIKDGFRIRKLISHVIIDEYETIDYQGFISPKAYLKKHTTNIIVGYAIAITIEW